MKLPQQVIIERLGLSESQQRVFWSLWCSGFAHYLPLHWGYAFVTYFLRRLALPKYTSKQFVAVLKLQKFLQKKIQEGKKKK